MNRVKLFLSVVCTVLTVHTSIAEVKPHGLFRQSMVLQRGVQIPVYGTADEGEEITVTFKKETKTAIAKDGKWKVFFKSAKAGGPYKMTIKGKNNAITISDILVGDVWICGGQSNMQRPLSKADYTDKDLKSGSNKKIRLYTVSFRPAAELEPDIPKNDNGWVNCSEKTALEFSGTGFYFGQKLYSEINIPVGLISSAVGGTAAELWTPEKVLAASPDFSYKFGEYDELVKSYPEREEKYKKELEEWNKNKQGRKPRKIKGTGEYNDAARPSSLYNGMINPLIDFPVKGVTFYQGEANSHTFESCQEYGKLFPAMISAWRTGWKNEELPFFFVQLAAFKKVNNLPEDSEWSWLRESQAKALSLPNTGMALAIDIGMEQDIHPTNKKDVGYRLALNALKTVYSKNIVHSGPTFASHEIADNKVIITFDNIGSGLVAKDVLLETYRMNADELKGFAVCGEDEKFIWADAEIEGNKVIVSSAKVKKPIAVRYAWANFPLCNLYNKEGLPAGPFRTDNFEAPKDRKRR